MRKNKVTESITTIDSVKEFNQGHRSRTLSITVEEVKIDGKTEAEFTSIHGSDMNGDMSVLKIVKVEQMSLSNLKKLSKNSIIFVKHNSRQQRKQRRINQQKNRQQLYLQNLPLFPSPIIKIPVRQHTKGNLTISLEHNEFKEFMKKKYAEENLLFLQQSRKFKNEDNPHARARMYKSIVEQFLRQNSIHAINIGAETRKHLLLHDKRHVKKTLLDSAITAIEDLMHTNNFVTDFLITLKND